MDYPCVPQPVHIRTGLFYHQLVSIYNMENLETNNTIWVDDTVYIKTRVGILADMPGYGKTLSMLGLIARDSARPMTDDASSSVYKKIESGSELCKRVRLQPVDDVDATLIITNPSLIGQWEKELSCTSLAYEVVKAKRDVENIGAQSIVLCPSNFYHAFSTVFKDCRFRRLVIDEPNTVKLTGLNGVSARFIWLMTATPFDLFGKTRSKYLNDILPDDFDIVGNIIIKNPDAFVKSSFEMPPTRHTYIESTDLCPKLLKGIIPDCQYAMLASGNIGRFLSTVGIKRDSQKHFLLQLEEHMKESHADVPRLQVLQQRIRDIMRVDCHICMDGIQNPLVTSCCQQVMCTGCLTAWIDLTGTCPVCRAQLTLQNTTYIDVPMDETSDHIKPVSRFQIVDRILKAKDGSKILIYTHFEKTGQQLQKFLGTAFQWADLRGTRGHKEKVLDDYKSGSLNILLLTSLVDSAGFNLENTTDIVMFDQPSEYIETQVIGRALRVGRTCELNVHHIV